ncbi:MAG TPA: hypothetical protein VN368_02185 [Candidatus Methylomirabilis sp.]|nr:hypothetical protein [Candidatus Methylomirabilis sp.]
MASNTVPKSITRIREEWNGLPVRYVLIVISFLMLSLILIASILLSDSVQWIFLVILFFELAFFFKFLRTPKVMDRSVLMSHFFLRSIKGETVIAKFKLPAGFLERIIPVKTFHEDGIIEFMENKYGLLMRIEPSRISEDDIDMHIQRTRALVDSLHGELLTKAFVCSIQESNYRPLARNIVNIINTQERTPEQKRHLDSIYHHAMENNNTVIQWKFYVFLSLGTHATLNKAIIAKKQYFPGFSEKLQKLGIIVMPLKKKKALASAYKQCITQGGYT